MTDTGAFTELFHVENFHERDALSVVHAFHGGE
jgi:hypothetical protein